jgi:type II secretory pathway component HofQ
MAITAWGLGFGTRFVRQAATPTEQPSAAARTQVDTEPTDDPNVSGVSTSPASRPIEGWLTDIASDAGVGLVLGPGVAGTEVMAVFPATADWQSRLRALARVNGFVFRRDAGLLEVELATPVPDAPALPTAPVAPAIAAATVQPERIASAVLRLVNARAADLAAALERPLGSGGVSSGVDAATNAIVFGGPVSAVDDALELARKLDVPRRRFLLEAHIVEISRSTSSEMGVQWTLESNDLGAIVDFPAADAAGEGAGILVATSGTHSLRARLSALESSGRVRVVSRPRIVVLEGKAASIEAVRILRVRLPDRGTVVAEADSNASLDSGRAFG